MRPCFRAATLFRLCAVRDDETKLLAQVPFVYTEEQLYALEFAVQGNNLSLHIDGAPCLLSRMRMQHWIAAAPVS